MSTIVTLRPLGVVSFDSVRATSTVALAAGWAWGAAAAWAAVSG